MTVKISALDKLIQIANKVSTKLSKVASHSFTTKTNLEVAVHQIGDKLLVAIDGETFPLTRDDAVKLAKTLSEHALSMVDQELEGEKFSPHQSSEVDGLKLERLPNGLVRVEDRRSGLTGLWNADTGKPRSGDLAYGNKAEQATNAVRRFLGL